MTARTAQTNTSESGGTPRAIAPSTATKGSLSADGLSREWYGSRPRKSAREPGEDCEVRVKLHALQAAHSQRGERPAVLQVAELALDGRATGVELSPPW